MAIDENTMIDILEKVLDHLKRSNADVEMYQSFFDVGEWLLCFEGVLVQEEKTPEIFSDYSDEMNKLKEYFGPYMEE
jgi:hypothetical protein